jgi:hypothetical protein
MELGYRFAIYSIICGLLDLSINGNKIKLSEIIIKGFDALLKPGNNQIKVLVEPDD